MGEVVRTVVFMMALISCNALLDLSGVHEVKGTWMGSTTLPCTYRPSDDFTQETLIWSMEREDSTSTVFRRDDSGDHILLSKFRDRVSVPKHSPGDASLLIEKLEIPDSGHYTCQVIWRSKNNSLIKKEVTTTVKVVKVAATKPVIRASEPGLTFAPGARTSLTCVASGSPPISYRWFRSGPGGEALLLSSQAELAWDSLQPSDTGTYFCEAENRVGARAVQQSDAVELTVRERPVTRQPSPEAGRPQPTPRGDAPQRVPTGTQGTRLSLPLVILIAVVCSAVVFLLVFIIICIRKPKEVQVYEVKDHNLRAAASSRCESAGHYEEPICSTENNYVMEHMVNKRSQEISTEKNEYDCVGNTQESVYEVGDTA